MLALMTSSIPSAYQICAPYGQTQTRPQQPRGEDEYFTMLDDNCMITLLTGLRQKV